MVVPGHTGAGGVSLWGAGVAGRERGAGRKKRGVSERQPLPLSFFHHPLAQARAGNTHAAQPHARARTPHMACRSVPHPASCSAARRPAALTAAASLSGRPPHPLRGGASPLPDRTTPRRQAPPGAADLATGSSSPMLGSLDEGMEEESEIFGGTHLWASAAPSRKRAGVSAPPRPATRASTRVHPPLALDVQPNYPLRGCSGEVFHPPQQPSHQKYKQNLAAALYHAPAPMLIIQSPFLTQAAPPSPACTTSAYW